MAFFCFVIDPLKREISMDNIFWLALALALIIEGLIPALFPNKWKAYVIKLAQEPINRIRISGLIIMSLGVIIWCFVTT